jgi:hypothetical protein
VSTDCVDDDVVRRRDVVKRTGAHIDHFSRTKILANSAASLRMVVVTMAPNLAASCTVSPPTRPRLERRGHGRPQLACRKRFLTIDTALA